jgi:hypothetical protein
MKQQLNEVKRWQKLAGIITEVKDLDIFSLQQGKFAGEKLLGHYILDSRSTPFEVAIDLAKTPDQKGKTSMEQKAFTIVYYPENNKWDLSDSPVKPTPEDQKILDSIASEYNK